MTTFVCVMCSNAVDPTDVNVWQRVTGWERKRDAGGTNAIALRTPVQEFMCATCMVAAKRGLVGQEAML